MKLILESIIEFPSEDFFTKLVRRNYTKTLRAISRTFIFEINQSFIDLDSKQALMKKENWSPVMMFRYGLCSDGLKIFEENYTSDGLMVMLSYNLSGDCVSQVKILGSYKAAKLVK